ncbi:hypothetical protein, partial [Bacillus pseudomycoides]|uniref:hypothetical protein n=1 Tax=Bacillus pseudomycoides TaxID=64104 RepID=UPI00196A9658
RDKFILFIEHGRCGYVKQKMICTRLFYLLYRRMWQKKDLTSSKSSRFSLKKDFYVRFSICI